MSNFEDRLDDFHKISLYRHGAPWAKLEAKRWLQKVMEGVE